MDSNGEHRRVAMRIARETGAEHTLNVLRDPESTTDHIFRAAAAEVDRDELIARLLENDPAWAYFALVSLPELGEQSEPLRRHAAVFEQRAAQSLPGAESVAPDASSPDATINKFNQADFTFVAGDLITMVVHQVSGSDWWPRYVYKYVPGNGRVAVTDSWGPAGSLKFSSSIQDWNPNDG